MIYLQFIVAAILAISHRALSKCCLHHYGFCNQSLLYPCVLLLDDTTTSETSPLPVYSDKFMVSCGIYLGTWLVKP